VQSTRSVYNRRALTNYSLNTNTVHDVMSASSSPKNARKNSISPPRSSLPPRASTSFAKSITPNAKKKEDSDLTLQQPKAVSEAQPKIDEESDMAQERKRQRKKMRDKYRQRYKIDDDDSLNGDDDDLEDPTPRESYGIDDDVDEDEYGSQGEEESDEDDVEDTLLGLSDDDSSEDDKEERSKSPTKFFTDVEESQFFEKMAEEPIDDLDVFSKLDDLQVQREVLRGMNSDEFIDFLANYKMVNWDALKEQKGIIAHQIEQDAREMGYILTGSGSMDFISNDTLYSLQQSPLEIAYSLAGVNLKPPTLKPTGSLPKSHFSIVRETVSRIMSTFFITLNNKNDSADIEDTDKVRVFVDLSYNNIVPLVRNVLQEQFLKMKQITIAGSQEIWQQQKVFREIKKQWERREELLIQACNEQMSRLNADLKHREHECVLLGEQLNKVNETLGVVTQEYGNDFSQLKSHLLQKFRRTTSNSNLIGSNTKQLNNSSKEITMLSSMGNSLSTQLTQLLEEERARSAKSLLKLHKKYEKEKKELANNLEKDLIQWKKRLFDMINQKKTEDVEWKSKLAKQKERSRELREKLQLANDKITYLSKLANDVPLSTRRSHKQSARRQVDEESSSSESEYDDMDVGERSQALKRVRDRLLRKLIDRHMTLNQRLVNEVERANLEKRIIDELDAVLNTTEILSETQRALTNIKRHSIAMLARPRAYSTMLIARERIRAAKEEDTKALVESKRTSYEVRLAELSILCKSQAARLLTMKLRINQLSKKLETSMKVNRDLRKKEKEQQLLNKKLEIVMTQTKKKMETEHFQLEAAKDTIEANERAIFALREENRILSEQLWRERAKLKREDGEISDGSRRRVSMLLAMQEKKRRQTKALLDIKDNSEEEMNRKLRGLTSRRSSALSTRRSSMSSSRTTRKHLKQEENNEEEDETTEKGEETEEKDRVKALEDTVDELQGQVDDFIVAMEGIDLDTVTQLSKAVEDAESYDEQLTERLHGWDKILSEKLSRPMIKNDETKTPTTPTNELPMIVGSEDLPVKKSSNNSPIHKVSSPARNRSSPSRPSTKDMYTKQLERLRKKDEEEKKKEMEKKKENEKNEKKIEKPQELEKKKKEEEKAVYSEDDEQQRIGQLAELRLIEDTFGTSVNFNDDTHWMVDEEQDRELFRMGSDLSPLGKAMPKKTPISIPKKRKIDKKRPSPIVVHDSPLVEEEKKLVESSPQKHIPDIMFGMNDKMLSMSQALDILLSNLELDEGLSERDRKVLHLIRTKKHNMEMERQKKWGAVMNMAKQLNEIRKDMGMYHPRVQNPVALSIQTINDYFDSEVKEKHHNALPSTFSVMQSSSPVFRTFVHSRPSTSYDDRPLSRHSLLRDGLRSAGTPLSPEEIERPHTAAATSLSQSGLRKLEKIPGRYSVPTPTQKHKEF
jgi:hypothetical protein